jgi:hypothetical protein
MVTALIASGIVFVLCVAAHLIAMRVRPTKNRLGAMTAAFLPGFPLALLAVFVMHRCGGWPALMDGNEDPLLAYVLVLILHLLLYFLFVECFYHVERSVTLRLLVELDEHPRGAATTAEIMRDYSVDDMIRRRLDDLVRNRWAEEIGGRFRLTEKGRRLARLMRASNWVYQSKPQNERL